jgi:hypothetical protein
VVSSNDFACRGSHTARLTQPSSQSSNNIINNTKPPRFYQQSVIFHNTNLAFVLVFACLTTNLTTPALSASRGERVQNRPANQRNKKIRDPGSQQPRASKTRAPASWVFYLAV